MSSVWSSGWFYHPRSNGNIAVCPPASKELIQNFILGTTVDIRKDSRGLRCLCILPARETWLQGCTFLGLKNILSEQIIGQFHSISVQLQLSIRFETLAAEELCRGTSLEVRERATTDTCSSSVLWTHRISYEPRRNKGR